MIPPIRPISWCGGSQIMPRLSLECPKSRKINSELLIRFRCVRTTPFGAEVEPEVYCSSAIDSAHTWAESQARECTAGTSSVVITGSRDSSGTDPDGEPTAAPIAAVVSTAEGMASCATAASRGSERSSLSGSGGHVGTAITPAYKQPKNAAMYSRPGG